MLNLFLIIFFFLFQENILDEEDSKKWDILREDYMMGANMKDWDKESDSDNNNVNNELDSDSDSG